MHVYTHLYRDVHTSSMAHARTDMHADATEQASGHSERVARQQQGRVQ